MSRVIRIDSCVSVRLLVVVLLGFLWCSIEISLDNVWCSFFVSWVIFGVVNLLFVINW